MTSAIGGFDTGRLKSPGMATLRRLKKTSLHFERSKTKLRTGEHDDDTNSECIAYQLEPW